MIQATLNKTSFTLIWKYFMHLVRFLKSYIIHWQVPEPDWDIQSSIFSQWWTAKMMPKKKALVVITVHKYSHSPSLKLAMAVQPAMVNRQWAQVPCVTSGRKPLRPTCYLWCSLYLPTVTSDIPHGIRNIPWRVCQLRFLNEKDTAQRSSNLRQAC